jgi:filamentous hemagglutinin
MAHYGADPSTGIRFEVNQSAMNVLDLTNADTAASWGYAGGPIKSATQQLGSDAAAAGYNAIRYYSERAIEGTNLAVLGDFNSILKPVMVTPAMP